ncbi:MAG: FtsX-like permease family protein [Kordiimonadaceae bacterium]|jgi:putative ABC transport system permease protein|nr:FtsX-like permease family protein [Kordiimonadaceae bacterium]
MYRNYFTIAIRILLRNKLFSIINIGGLTIGLTAAFLIILFVKSEMSYDRWLPSYDNIYTIETLSTPPARAPKVLSKTPLEIRAAIEKDFREIESFTRFYAGTSPIIIDNNNFPEKSFRIEETFFDVFQFPFKEGNAKSALALANTAVITEQLAAKYFPGQSAIGKTLTVGENDFNITGVLAEFTGKTHLDFEILLYDGPGELDIDFIDWTSSRIYSYFTLIKSGNIDSLTEGAADFLNRNAFFAPESWQDYTPSDVMGLSFLSLPDIHLKAKGTNPISPNGSSTLVYGFIAIAALIMVMASINFINLSTANSSTREKEIAIHKVVGAKRSQLIIRYLTEALSLVSIAFLFSLILTSLFAPLVFNWIGLIDVEGTKLGFDFFIIAASSSVITALLAGLYPAFHLSSKSLASAFSGGRSNSPRAANFRLGLIFFQYTISIILVIASCHFYLQTRLATTMDLGFSDDNIVSYWGVSGAPDFTSQQALLDRVRQVPGVSSVTRMAQVPGNNSQNNATLKSLDTDNLSGSTTIQSVAADADFEKTLDMTLLAGRSFEQGRTIDKMTENKATIIINELARSALGFANAEDAIGKSFQMQDYSFDPINVEIIGVMKNAHFQTIHSELSPLLFINADVFFNAMVVKVNANNAQALNAIDAIWPQYVPDVAVYKTYLTDDLAAQYQIETRQTQVYGGFAALAVVIAFMGIFGLAAFNVERRTKEIGIRKVFGATIFDVVRLFVWQFSKPVLFAIITAWPLAALMINNWLESYAYRIDLAPLIFISAGASVLMIAWLTVASQAAKAAMANPILSLRYE